jgi:hypothetical protein
VGQDHGVHGAGRGAGYSIDAKPRFLEQAVKHAPGECPMCAAPLERKIDKRRITVHEISNPLNSALR